MCFPSGRKPDDCSELFPGMDPEAINHQKHLSACFVPGPMLDAGDMNRKSEMAPALKKKLTLEKSPIKPINLYLL